MSVAIIKKHTLALLSFNGIFHSFTLTYSFFLFGDPIILEHFHFLSQIRSADIFVVNGYFYFYGVNGALKKYMRNSKSHMKSQRNNSIYFHI